VAFHDIFALQRAIARRSTGGGRVVEEVVAATDKATISALVLARAVGIQSAYFDVISVRSLALS